jgi:gamma-tubulin complex component 2
MAICRVKVAPKVRGSPPRISHILKLRPGQTEPSFIAETSFVRAPLNSRVSSTAGIPKAKGKAKQEPLDNVPVDIQETLILEDMLYILMVRGFVFKVF